jgi:hypothetical protein
MISHHDVTCPCAIYGHAPGRRLTSTTGVLDQPTEQLGRRRSSPDEYEEITRGVGEDPTRDFFDPTGDGCAGHGIGHSTDVRRGAMKRGVEPRAEARPNSAVLETGDQAVFDRSTSESGDASRGG